MNLNKERLDPFIVDKIMEKFQGSSRKYNSSDNLGTEYAWSIDSFIVQKSIIPIIFLPLYLDLPLLRPLFIIFNFFVEGISPFRSPFIFGILIGWKGFRH
jgi:hypothetical protein